MSRSHEGLCLSAPGDMGAHSHLGVDAKLCYENVEQVPHNALATKLESK